MNLTKLFSLEGKVAIVTGASKGIGEAIAQGLAAYGAKVVVSSRKQAAVDEVASQIKEMGYEATGIAAHMGDMEQVAALATKTKELYGGIDIIVNNAAVNPVFGPIENTEIDAIDKIMDVNLKGPFELAKAALPSMQERGGGSIINISSIGGIKPEAQIGMYSVSKAAIINLTQAMAQDWGQYNIRANVICPGLIKTKFSEALWQNEKIATRFMAHLPLKRLGETEDLIGTAVFLASNASTYCTGATYTVDGGYLVA